MFRHYLIAAWRNMMANRLQSAIAIFGLAIGLAAAILAGIVAANQFSYDHFVPGYDRLYFAVTGFHDSHRDTYSSQTPHDLENYLHQDFPEIQAVTRLDLAGAVFGHGALQARESFNWADPNFFQLYRLPVLYGDLDHALAQPDGLVISLSIARKYFGRDNVVGQTLELDHQHEMKITAVIADLPANATNLQTGIFASSLASFSQMSLDAPRPGMTPDGGMNIDMATIARLAFGASLEDLNRRATALVERFVPNTVPYTRTLHFEAADRLHLSPQVHPDARPRFWALIAAALLTLTLACVNFVNLSTARSAQRGVEVAVRKVAGAGRSVLVVQFLGESILQVMFALVVAAALAEWLLPAVNAFLNAGAVFDYWREPGLIGLLLLGAVALGAAAGAYPALILSAFRPASVLKGWTRGASEGELVRRALVTLQFAAMIVLLIAAAVVFQQNQYATTEALRINTDQMLFVRMPKCNDAFKTQIAALPGVEGAACSSIRVLPESFNSHLATSLHGGQGISMSLVSVGTGLFELYGLTPVAGRFFRNDDLVPDNATYDQTAHYVVNGAAVRQLGYASPAEAVGKPLYFPGQQLPKPGDTPKILTLQGTIIGVVKDFAFTPNNNSANGDSRIPPTAYSAGLSAINELPNPELLHVKLRGQDIPETLAAIDAAWRKSGSLDPIRRTFLDTYVQNQEISVLRQGEAFAAFAGIAMFLACLGLFGVSLFTAARRTKEIGIRKVMGASDTDILALLLWQFGKPVLWANLIAWPLAWWAMNRWLSNFAYHVDLNLWLFLAASLTALLIALASVLGQAILVARQRPVLALRYE